MALSKLWTIGDVELGLKHTVSDRNIKDIERRETNRKSVKGFDRETISNTNKPYWAK